MYIQIGQPDFTSPFLNTEKTQCEPEVPSRDFHLGVVMDLPAHAKAQDMRWGLPSLRDPDIRVSSMVDDLCVAVPRPS